MGPRERGEERTCAMCDKSVDGREWIGLNRFVVGTADGANQMSEVRDLLNDAYRWDIPNCTASMYWLCWPDCATMYFDGKLIETRCSDG